MTALQKFRPQYTLKDYQGWEGDWELWAGTPVSMSPGPFGRHQTVAANLMYELRKELERVGFNAEVLYELDWIVSDDTVVRPDLVIICGRGPDQHLMSPPAIVAEVISASTEQRDRTYKRDLYREQDVEAYLLVDPEREKMEVDRKDSRGVWITESVTNPITLRLCQDCKIKVNPSTLFGR